MPRQADKTDLRTIAALACELWPENTADEMMADFAAIMEDAAIFLAEAEGQAVGFAQCQLRRDYVEGTETSPVGYLEGVYVRDAFRRQGHARALVRTCEAWSRSHGCTEFASDCELENGHSLRLHLALGFQEASRIICFTKKL